MLVNPQSTTSELKRLIRHSTNTSGFFAKKSSDIKDWGKTYFKNSVETFKLDRPLNQLCDDLMLMVQKLEDNLAEITPENQKIFLQLKKLYQINPNNHADALAAATLMSDIFHDESTHLTMNTDLKILTFCVFKNIALKVQHKYLKILNKPNNNLAIALNKAFNYTKTDIHNLSNKITNMSANSKNEVSKFYIPTEKTDIAAMEKKLRQAAKDNAIKHGEQLTTRLEDLNKQVSGMQEESDDALKKLLPKMKRFSENQFNTCSSSLSSCIGMLDFISSSWGKLIHNATSLAHNEYKIIANRLKEIQKLGNNESNYNEITSLILTADELIERSFFYDNSGNKLASVIQELQTHPLNVPILLMQNIQTELRSILEDIKNKQELNRQLNQELINLSEANNYISKISTLKIINEIIHELEPKGSGSTLKAEMLNLKKQIKTIDYTRQIINNYIARVEFLTLEFSATDLLQNIDDEIAKDQKLTSRLMDCETDIAELTHTISLSSAYQKQINCESNSSKKTLLLDSYNSITNDINKKLAKLDLDKNVNSEDAASMIDSKKDMTAAINRLKLSVKSPSLKRSESIAKRSSNALTNVMNQLVQFSEVLDIDLSNIKKMLSISNFNDAHLTIRQQITLLGVILNSLSVMNEQASIMASPMVSFIQNDQRDSKFEQYDKKVGSRVESLNGNLNNILTPELLSPLLKTAIFDLVASDKFTKVNALILSSKHLKKSAEKMLPDDLNLSKALWKWYSYLRGNNKAHHRTFYTESRKLFNLIMLYRYIDTLSPENKSNMIDTNQLYDAPPSYTALFGDKDVFGFDYNSKDAGIAHIIKNIWKDPADKDGSIKKIARFITQKSKGKNKGTEMGLVLKALFGYNKDFLAAQLKQLTDEAQLNKFKESLDTQGIDVGNLMVRNLVKAVMSNELNSDSASGEIKTLLGLLDNLEIEKI
ncbi:MAG: hypothetical protein LW807_04940 [Proteobacteria bacterium]|nr:hypothetical protein [Pseudomonadota bacterium]